MSGNVYGLDLTYVKDIQYDEYGQRTRIEYGNGSVTDYTYDEHRRWLSTLHTDSKLGETLQNLKYSFDRVGNVLGYTNNCLDEDGNYTTAQSYTYDGLYQLTSATGESVYNPHRGGVPDYRTTYTQNFSFDSAGLGKMLSKTSSMTVSQGKTLGGDGLVYDLDYEYDSDFVHRLKRAGDRYYKYDESGRLTEEREGTEEETSDTTRLTRTVKKHSESVFSQDYGWGLSNDATREAQNAAKDRGSDNNTGTASGDSGFKRSYTWDEKGRLTATSDQNADVEYLYGEDNQRAVKSSDMGETLYFNNFWTWSNNSTVYNGERTAKHIFLGSERIVTKLNSAKYPTYSEESASTYYYHSDHLGSASVITDNDGREYERIEYTPYGEVWIDKASATYKTPYRFTGKERDEETGLYYFGERYLDGKVSRWLSCDPALSEYMGGTSAGCGGAYNSLNLNLYHYAGNNPIKYTDPDGNFVLSAIAAKVVGGAVIGAVAGAATSVIVQTAANMVKNGGNLQEAINNIDMKSVGAAAISGAISGAITGGVGEVSTAYNCLKGVKAIVNAGANMAGTTVGTMVDNAARDKTLSQNLVRNNLIAGGAGALSAQLSQTAAGTVVDQTGKKSSVWFETLDQAGKITSMSVKEPVDIAVNNLLKESAVSVAQESLTTTLDNK